jgi:hypothetical protein
VRRRPSDVNRISWNQGETERQREAIGQDADALVTRAEQAVRELEEQRARRDAAAADLARRESEASQLAAEHSEMPAC